MTTSADRPPRVRIAPAPSGTLHVGNIRTALYNWLHARARGGTFILRIEDTDQQRATPESVRGVLEALRWAGLDWDEGPQVGGAHGPYVQSERAVFHAAVVRRLLAAGDAFEDFATAQELQAHRETQRAAARPPLLKGPLRSERRPGETGAPSIRMRTPTSGEVAVDDLVRGRVSFDWSDIGDFVIQRADGSATYPLANAADDVAQGVTLVCRGEDLLSVTPRQLLLYEALTRADDEGRGALVDAALDESGLPARAPGWGPPTGFAHLSLVVGDDRKPLSKRHGSVAVAEFARHGYLPEVLVNYLALLGWAPGDGRERMTVDELIAAFDLAAVGRTAAAFDEDKLAAFNGERIRALTREELTERLVPFLDGTYGQALIGRPPDDQELRLLRGLVPLVQERMQRLDEVQEYAPAFFREAVELDPDAVAKVLGKDAAVTALEAAHRALDGLEPWTADAIEQVLRGLLDQLSMGARKVFQPVRVAVTGSSVSPPLFESLEL
ncbi:MAG TPA: glutamate--tRNA ligase family protein, partial [Nitriliruptorales bacterium]|nr:glutamate--tRNA ligase family protein [Nitriliruptorales bacterium]